MNLLFFINGQKCTALIDTGSVDTTICEEFYNIVNPRPELRDMSNFDLNMTGASGSSISYIGYIEAQVSMSDIDHDPLTVPILILSTTRFSGQVPIIVGTNILLHSRIKTMELHLFHQRGITLSMYFLVHNLK